MRGRCEKCDTALDVSDMAETYKCPQCGNRSHPEFLRPINRTGGSFLSPTSDIESLRTEALEEIEKRRWTCFYVGARTMHPSWPRKIEVNRKPIIGEILDNGGPFLFTVAHVSEESGMLELVARVRPASPSTLRFVDVSK